MTAVDAESGEFVVFDKDSGVDLVHAVAARAGRQQAAGVVDRIAALWSHAATP